MYQIERKDYGYYLTFGDLIKADEMNRWVSESKQEMLSAPSQFGVFVDMRTLAPLPEDAQVAMQEGQKLYKSKGMTRSVVIVNSKITKMQFMRIAKETGIYEWERYIDATAVPNWEDVGVAWLTEATDPDL
ncbi:MAG: hypothetical protein IV090_02030 [Candidatus Sericytochromatia bacterium]|nr:hypothetical protein [Candidatus Sericytochromatia bacterium]